MPSQERATRRIHVRTHTITNKQTAIHSFIHLFTRSFHSFNHSLIHSSLSFIQPCLHSFIHSFIQPGMANLEGFEPSDPTGCVAGSSVRVGPGSCRCSECQLPESLNTERIRSVTYTYGFSNRVPYWVPQYPFAFFFLGPLIKNQILGNRVPLLLRGQSGTYLKYP